MLKERIRNISYKSLWRCLLFDAIESSVMSALNIIFCLTTCGITVPIVDCSCLRVIATLDAKVVFRNIMVPKLVLGVAVYSTFCAVMIRLQ